MKRLGNWGDFLFRIAAIAGMACVLSGCGGSAKKVELPNAVMAKQVPVYPGAKLESQMGGTTSDGVGGREITKSMSWFLKVSDPPEKVVEFYEKEWSSASKGQNDDGDTVFDGTFDGAESEESLKVTVRSDEIQITEILSPSRVKDRYDD
ncbi:MAG: hypothetical protein K1X53_03415 [Candidatus Sumerlaeaceae bacterium]|nr:hypothetical protein [Candidatus Sumerlaeaceae bacterium]